MPDPLAYRRTHSLLLVQRLLSFRPGVSPLTVILDSLEQSGRPVVQECIARAKSSKTHTIFLSFETREAPPGIDVFLPSRRKNFTSLQKDVTAAIGSSTATLLILDTLHALLHQAIPLPQVLQGLARPGVSLLVVFHVDVPIPLPSSPQASWNPYAPSPLLLLKSLCTTLLTPTSLQHAHATHVAGLRSLPEPVHGLAEGRDGVLVGLGANGGGARLEDAPIGLGRGVVLDVEHRRKSGRGVVERVFVAMEDAGEEGRPAHTLEKVEKSEKQALPRPRPITLLDDHPLFATPSLGEKSGGHADVDDDETPEKAATTFNLSLTERQRADRAGVVLPYYDAQREGGEGVAAGGRILYQMGLEDAGDWDSEEDEL